MLARRFLCRVCGAVLLVVPRGIAYRALYTVSAIALALALWAVGKQSPPRVRERVSPWRTVGFRAKSGWASLRRWARRAHNLWPGLRRAPAHWSTRQVAERVATALAGHAPQVGGELLARVFAGAAQAL